MEGSGRRRQEPNVTSRRIRSLQDDDFPGLHTQCHDSALDRDFSIILVNFRLFQDGDAKSVKDQNDEEKNGALFCPKFPKLYKFENACNQFYLPCPKYLKVLPLFRKRMKQIKYFCSVLDQTKFYQN